MLLVKIAKKDDEEEMEPAIFAMFRKVFDKLPDREKHVEAMSNFNEDFCNVLFSMDISTEEELEETQDMVSSCIHNVGEAELKKIYGHLMDIKEIKRILNEIDPDDLWKDGLTKIRHQQTWWKLTIMLVMIEV